jgi:hypothetical protein
VFNAWGEEGTGRSSAIESELIKISSPVEESRECIQRESSSLKANTLARDPPGKRWTGSDRSFSHLLTVRSSRSKKAAISFQESSRRFAVGAS